MKRGKVAIFTFVLAVITLTLALSSCRMMLMKEKSAGEIRIGLDLPLTGQHAAPYGLPMQRGFELARQEINTSPQRLGNFSRLTFITEDDQSTVEGAVNAFLKLIHQDDVSVITGLAISTQGKKVFPIAQENQVVMFSSLSSAAGLSALGDFIFRAGLTTDVLIPYGVEVTRKKLGYKKVAMMYDAMDVYSTSSSEELRKALTTNGIKILSTETFKTGNTDFFARLARIKAANPDAIFISALAREMIRIMIQARKLGIPSSVPFIVPDLSRDEVEAAGDASEGAITFTGWSSTVDTARNQAFVHNYRAKYGIDPEPWAAQSYATLHILAEAIANARSTDSKAIRDALAKIKDFDTILGKFSFNADGDAIYDPIILQGQER